jgi:hypothetical protein
MPVVWYVCFDEPGMNDFNTLTARAIADEGRAHEVTANSIYVTIV